MGPKIVVDTSALIKWFKTRDEALLKEAEQLLEEIDRHHIEVHVPALLLYEVGNILLVKTRLGLGGLDEAIERLEALPLCGGAASHALAQARSPSRPRV